MLNRRDVLNLAVSAGAASAFLPGAVRSEEPDRAKSLPIIDTNVSLCQWPFRRLPLDDPAAFVKKLRVLGITQAWAGSFEGLLHRDISAVNRRLHNACVETDRLIAIGSINPTLPDWERDLEECFESFRMPGVRLHPNYHGYALDDPRFRKLLSLATTASRFVQIAVAMEDTRTQNALVQVGDVDLSLLQVNMGLDSAPRVQILNHRLRLPALRHLAETPGIYFDTARVEATDGVPALVQSLPAGRVMYGSHSPFLVPEAALIRVHESGRLDREGLRAVYSRNAESFMENAGK